MSTINLLILDGPPAAGKSSLGRVIALELRHHKIPHALIDMDDLAGIYPLSKPGIMYKILADIWPNYADLEGLKVIIPTYMQAGELELIMKAAQAKQTTVCELVVPHTEAARRIKKREANQEVQKRLLKYLSGYANNKTPLDQIDFQVSNFNRPVQDTAQEIIEKLGWLSSPRKMA